MVVAARVEAVGVVGRCTPACVAAEASLCKVDVEEVEGAVTDYVGGVHLLLCQAGVEGFGSHFKKADVERRVGHAYHDVAGASPPYICEVAAFLRTYVGI